PDRPDAVAFGGCTRKKIPKGAFLFARRRPPIQTVFSSRPADNAPGIRARACSGSILLGIFVLRINVSQTGLDRIQLVLSDTAEENFITTNGSVEQPFSVLQHKRNWKWEFFL